MKQLFSKTALFSTAVAFGIIVIPALSFASNYSVSPVVSGYTVVSVAQANTICQSVPDAIAAGLTFCRFNNTGTISYGTPVASNIMASNITSSSATISWTTDQLTTTLLWYSNSSNPGQLIGYANPSQGYTTSHSIALSGISTANGYNYIVGGNNSAGTLGYSTAQTFPPSNTTAYSAPVISISSISSNGVIVNVTSGQSIRAQINYSGPNGVVNTSYSSMTYSTSNPIYLNNLSDHTNYKATVTVYDQNNTIIGSYPENFRT